MMIRVACVMMLKNERILVEPWLLYHGYLFGFENLFVFDNGSTDPTVRAVLEKFKTVGVTVDYSKTAPNDFDRKGFVIGDLINEFKKDGRYDIVFPLDCDEFVAICSGQGVSCRRDEIMTEIDRLAPLHRAVRVGRCLDNRPGFIDVFRFPNFKKTIMPVADFELIDHGFHEGRTTNHFEMCPTDIIYIHLHYKPFAMQQEHARAKLEPFVDVNDENALRSFTGVGKHLPRYLFMKEEDYYSDFGDYRYPLVHFDGFEKLLSVLASQNDFLRVWCARPAGLQVVDGHLLSRRVLDLCLPFDGASYLQANPDVEKASMNPVIHYILFGATEGRQLFPQK